MKEICLQMRLKPSSDWRGEQMLRAATIQMETELSQDEFEIWLLGLIRAVATKPERSSILK